MSEVSEFDIAVVGGGLHGVSIAAEAASRGLNVVLLQGKDLASGPTGSIRSVLRGGLRKLEQLQLTSVNQNLYEIALLKSKASHLLHFHKFKIYAYPQLRSYKHVQRGLKLYRYLQNRQLKKFGLREHFDTDTDNDLCYYDYQLANPRLILTLALQAKNLGASIRPHQSVTASQRKSDHWQLEIEDHAHCQQYSLRAGILINCCGWLAGTFLRDVLKVPTRCSAQILHFCQVVVRKPFPFTEGKVFQLPNQHLLYAHNLDEKHFVLGPVFARENSEAAKNLAIENALSIWNQACGTNIGFTDIALSNWASRAKPEDPLSSENGVYRECLLDLNNPGQAAPLLNVFGMYSVRHRLLAEQAIEILQPFTGAKKQPGFIHQPLPGGDFKFAKDGFGGDSLSEFIAHYKKRLPTDLHTTAERLVHSYGSLSAGLLDAIATNTQGEHFGHGLFANEVNYLLQYEWAGSAEDILWRRSCLGLLFNDAERAALENWITRQKS